MMKVLLTGFGPFGEVKENQSWLAVKLLSELWDSSYELMVKEVPVCYKYVAEHIPKLLSEYNPDIVIHVGAGYPLFTSEIHLETIAHSSGYTELDVEGCCGPTSAHDICLSTAFDVENLVSKCQDEDSIIKFVKSDYSGRYLCEFIFFSSLNYCKEHDKKGSVIFVHLPPVTETCTIEVLKDGLKNVVLNCADQVCDR